MYGKIFINILLIAGLLILQLAFFNVLPKPFSSINIIIITLIFILILAGIEIAVWWAVAVGVFLDFYSFLPFGTNILALFITALLIIFLLQTYFTNRSLYSFIALTAIALVFHDTLKYFIIYLSGLFRSSPFVIIFSSRLMLDELWSALANIAAMIVVFYAVNYIGKGLKPVFLVRGIK